MSADRLAGLSRTTATAGKPKGNIASRAKQNAGVKDGTVRLGANGKSYNVYDAKTATWKRGVVTSKGSPTAKKTPPKTFSGSSASKTTKPKGPSWNQQGGGGLAGKNTPLKGLFKNSAITQGFK